METICERVIIINLGRLGFSKDLAELESQAVIVVEVRGPEHHRDFKVAVEVNGHVAEGSGASKREAEESAASALLEQLTG